MSQRWFAHLFLCTPPPGTSCAGGLKFMAAFALRGVSAPAASTCEEVVRMGHSAVASVGMEGDRSCLAFVLGRASGLAGDSSGPLVRAARIQAQAAASHNSGDTPHSCAM